MKLFKILAIAVMAMVSSASAQAGVALSNMGLDGTTYSSFVDGTNQTASIRSAVGFTVGGSDFTLSSVSAAMFGNGDAAKFAIYSDVGGNPGVVVSTSTSTTTSTRPTSCANGNAATGAKAATTFTGGARRIRVPS
jgi:hypothetical protein